MVTTLSIILISSCCVYIALVIFMYRGWANLPKHTVPPVANNRLKISVIIAVRNEETNIERTLDCLMAQDYPKDQYEVIVIDDHSTDSTADIVRSYHKQGVFLIQLNEKKPINSYKKLAISKGIEVAKGEVIVTTDGDCRMSKYWLSTVSECFEQNNYYMLSSPVLYSEESSFFERVQTLEFLYLIGLGAAGIGNGKPTTCNGANLAYRKDVFYDMGGFKGIDDVASGDDELLLHKVAEKHADKVGFCKSLDALVFTDAKPTLSSFLSQRKRWASKSTKYKDKKVVLLGVSIWLFNLFFVISIFAALTIYPALQGLVLICVLLKFIVELVFMYALTNFMGIKTYLKYLPILTLIHPFYLVYIGIIGNIGKYDWKGRSVN